MRSRISFPSTMRKVILHTKSAGTFPSHSTKPKSDRPYAKMADILLCAFKLVLTTSYFCLEFKSQKKIIFTLNEACRANLNANKRILISVIFALGH